MFNLFHIFKSKILNRGINSAASVSFVECGAKLHHDQSMFFFDDKIRNNQWEKLVHNLNGRKPFEAQSPFGVMFSSWFFIKIASEGVFYPLHNFLVGINHLKPRKVGYVTCFGNSSLNIYRSFTINYSSKVCYFSIFPHAESFLECIYSYLIIIAHSKFYTALND